MPGYVMVPAPKRIPVPGDKLIEEFIGRVRTGTRDVSFAHMVAPPGWSEPAQTPRFGELTYVLRGTMRIHIGAHDMVEVGARQAIWIEPELRVRYSNPKDEECEYFAVCVPAFSVEDARREE